MKVYTNKTSKEITDFINKRAKEINTECGFDLLPPVEVQFIKDESELGKEEFAEKMNAYMVNNMKEEGTT